MDILPIIFRLMGKKKEALRLVEIVRPAIKKIPPEAFPLIKQLIILLKQLNTLLRPALKEAQTVAPEAFDIVRDLWQTAFPEMVAQWQRTPVETMSTAPWWIQTSLNRLGADPKLKVDNNYAKATMDAVREFQKTHKQLDGKPLKVDGYAGLETLAALYLAVVSKGAQK